MTAVPKTGRLLIDPPGPGDWNMAVDQALLERAEHDRQVTLRIYQWSEPTLSLGYFQSHFSRQQHAASQECPLVRRRTGGGAIVHDLEVTYSIALPAQNRWARQNADLYDHVHEALITVIAETTGMESQRFGQLPQAAVSHPSADPFLCFQRRSSGDLICQGRKIVGSAQRRLKNSLLQHGSILLASSAFAPELEGIAELSSEPVQVPLFIEKTAHLIADSLQIELTEGKLEEEEQMVASKYLAEMFGNPSWNNRR